MNNTTLYSVPSISHEPSINVPFLRPSLSNDEINEVVDTLRSGWLTTGPKVKRFEQNFAQAVNAKYAVALSSCTAALHLAVEALGLSAGQAVLVPTMTFAATAEVILYKGAIPILVDCDPESGNLDLADAERKILQLRTGKLPSVIAPDAKIVGIIAVHVGGFMLDVDALKNFARRHNLWLVEDAAHAFPSAWRKDSQSEWTMCGEDTATVTCYSFYANKTITTGEGGMAVTNSDLIAERIRLMSLHGLSHDAWNRHTTQGSWDYKIFAPGYKYNLTDIAAAIGIHQLARAEEMRQQREEIALTYLQAFAEMEELDLPPICENRLHSWHLFPIRLRLNTLTVNRNLFIEELKRKHIGCSVHWRPLHLHPLYIDRFHWSEFHFPTASKLWSRLISLPIFPDMTLREVRYVIESVKFLCRKHTVQQKYLVA
jgi:dTDP-4-amino-4,6-dideoxygalactose transaminase